jgi:hypothetical protein
MAWISNTGVDIALEGIIRESIAKSNLRIKIRDFEIWKTKAYESRKRKKDDKIAILRCLIDNIRSNKVRVIKWNSVSKKLKYWLFEKIYESLDLPYESDIITHIIENYMKPNIKEDFNSIKYIDRKSLGEYIWKPHIFETKLFSNREVRCCSQECNQKIICDNREYYSVCSCGIQYCKNCYKNRFVNKDTGLVNDIIRCRNCCKDIHLDRVYEHCVGYSRFDLNKLYFNLNLKQHSLTVKLYDINKGYKDDMNIIYIIKLNLFRCGKVSIQGILRYIVFLRWYYKKTIHKEIIIFSKFYHLVNEILEHIRSFIEAKIILRDNYCYKNPRKMLEVFLVLDSIIKYY